MAIVTATQKKEKEGGGGTEEEREGSALYQKMKEKGVPVDF